MYILLLSSIKLIPSINSLDPLVEVRKGNIICNYCDYEITRLEDFNFNKFKKECSYKYTVRNKKYYDCGIKVAKFSYSYIKEVGDKLDRYRISLGVLSKSSCNTNNVYCEISECSQLYRCCEEDLCNDPDNLIINLPYIYKTIDPKLNITDNYQRYSNASCSILDPRYKKLRCLTADFKKIPTTAQPDTTQPTTTTQQHKNVAYIQKQTIFNILTSLLLFHRNNF